MKGVSCMRAAILVSFLLIPSIISCAKVQASNNPSAERVFTTEAGYVCFLIRDDEGKGVGGACLKE